jgi:exodeoxyribonuclease VII small subunit
MSKENKATIAEKMARLDELVTWLVSDEFELERAMEVFAQAETLAADIEGDLAAMKNTIQVVKAKFDE